MNFWEKNIGHLISFFKYLWERLFCVLIILGVILGISILILISSQINNPENIESQEILFLNISLDNWGTLITMLGLLATAIWSMYQYTKNKALNQQEKASLIAKDFADNIVEKFGLISSVLMSNQEIQKMVRKVSNSQKLKQFTTLEILNIINDSKCFLKFQKVIDSPRTQEKYKEILERKYNDFERNKFDSNFSLLIENTLNQLEALCINITSQAAGSQFIYNSLHQSFLYTIEVLAIKISTNNNNNVDKYYINIIQVYNMWNKQKSADIKKLRKTQKKIDKLNNKVDNEINKLLNKKGKAV